MAEHRPRAVLTVCVLCGAGLNAYLLGPSGVLPELASAYEVDKTATGLAISVPFAAWVVVQLPGGYLIDRYDNRAIVIAGATIVAATAASGLQIDTYDRFLALRLLSGIGAVLIWTTCANVVSHTFPADRRGVATSTFSASGPLGFAVAQFATPQISTIASWRLALAAYAGVTLLSAPFLLVFTSGPVRADEQIGIGAFLSALSNRPVIYVSLASFCTYSLFLFFNSWMATYATERLGMGLTTAGALSSLVPLAGVFARPLGGVFTDRLHHAPRVVIAWSFATLLPLLAAIPLLRSLPTFAVALLGAGLSCQVSVGVYYVLVRRLTDPWSSGTAFAVLSAISTVGTLTMPVITGWLVESMSWTAAFGFAALLAVIGLALFLVLPDEA